jgi:4-hydroxybenzoate polyprenyltransferase
MNLDIVLPILLLALGFVLKLVVDRAVGLVEFIQSLFELPTDIAFLAISMVVAFTISSPANNSEGLAWLIAYLVGVIVVVVMWRRSIKLLIETKRGTSTIKRNQQAYVACALAAINYGIAITGLVHSVDLVTP